ncbi:uncharacterized protein LOC144017337 [Festucalex cinctus]
MCKVQMLRALVKQRLNAAVEEIFVVFERAIAEYEEELCRTKEENKRQRQLLDAVFKPESGLNRDVSEEASHPERQEWSSGLEQQDPAPSHIKEEEAGEQIQGPALPMLGIVIKNEDCQSEENRRAEPQSGSSDRRMKTQNAEGSQEDSRFALLSISDDTTSHSLDTHDEQSQGDARRERTDDTCWKCSQCDKAFFNQTDLKKHMQWHTGERRFMCSDCGQTFSKKGHMITHTRTHTGEKPFSCSVCSKSFSVAFGLVQHMRSHTGEKPFSCSVCNKRFAYQICLMRHASTHTGEKPHSCSICNTSFRLRSALMTHMRTHTGEKPFICSVCDKRFAYKICLMRHASVHTGEKPHSCSVCNTNFRFRSALVTHMRTHTGGKLFSCSVCKKSFCANSTLRNHMRTHTGESI